MTNQHEKSPISALGLIIWTLTTLFYLYEFFLRTFIGSVANQIIPDLHLNAETFAILGSAYYIAYGIMQIPVGILADKLGVKIILIFATLVCVFSTMLFAHATTFTTGFIGRLLMGFGSSFAFVSMLVVVSTWFPRKFFGFFSGTSQFIGTMGPLLAGGPLIALMTHSHITWQQALTKIGEAGLVLTFLMFIFIRNKPRDKKQSVIYLTSSEPLKKQLPRLLKNKQAWYVAFYAATTYVSMALMGAIWGTAFLQAEGLSQNISATIISFAWLGYAVASPVIGAFSDIAKRRKPTLVVCALTGLICTTVIIFFQFKHTHWIYGILFFFLGFAASGQTLSYAVMTEHTDASLKATSIGLNNAAIMLFNAALPSIVSYFIYLSANSHGAALRPENFTLAFSVMPVLFFIAFLLSAFFITETYCKPQKEAIHLVRE